jgi:hypothetical protein
MMAQSFFCEEMAQSGSSAGYGPGATEVTALEDGSELLVNGRIKSWMPPPFLLRVVETLKVSYLHAVCSSA